MEEADGSQAQQKEDSVHTSFSKAEVLFFFFFVYWAQLSCPADTIPDTVWTLLKFTRT